MRGQIILRAIVSTPSELNFVIANARESKGLIDKFLITEVSHSHSGERKKQEFREIRNELPPDCKAIVHYEYVEIGHLVEKYRGEERTLKQNELITRNAFVETLDFKQNDLIISIDADEILYRRTFRLIWFLQRFMPGRIHLCFKLRQFMYRPNILWEKYKFVAPTVVSFGLMNSNIKPAWRYTGLRLPFWAGTHLSWHLTIEEMVYKLRNYAHLNLYSEYANRDLLLSAIQNLEYPFDPTAEAKLIKIGASTYWRLIPKSVQSLSWNHLGYSHE